jgi:hypothetical protein
LSIKEKVFGSDNPEVVLSLNNLAALYFEQHHYVDALPIIRRTSSQGKAAKDVAIPVLFESKGQQLISSSEALADSYDILQRASSSAAAKAVSKLAARFAAGTSALAQLVRNAQDLANEAERLDRIFTRDISKPPGDRSDEAETQIRQRLQTLKN